MKSNESSKLELQRKYWDKYREETRRRWNEKAVDTMIEKGRKWHRNLHDDLRWNIEELRNEIQRNPLSDKEQQFANAFRSKKLFIVHASSAVLTNNPQKNLLICSRQYLEDKKMKFSTDNSTQDDVYELGNLDYVFFSLEVGDKLQKSRSRFGNNFYRIPYTKNNVALRHSSMTLVDQLAPESYDGKMIKGLTSSTRDYLKRRNFMSCRVFFLGIDNCLDGLLYSIIIETRNLNEEKLKSDAEKILCARTDDEMNRVINGLFRPEVRVPRIFSASIAEYQAIMDKRY
ncbi:hypothetical protein [Xenorhabdus entomophaga]|uniref:hypothetical protein n=1 Tax=Xenorhabdus entomophaga TaxID=3136257 RepID=UPI0030F485C0